VNRFPLYSCAIITFAATLVVAVPSRGLAAESLCDPSFQDCRAPLLALIDAENVGIDVGFWFMEDQRYVARIINRWRAGVPVRLIVDPRANPTYPLNETSLDTFQAAGIPMVKKTGGGIMHWKTMIFAGQNTVEFGSANFSPNGFVPEAPYTNYVSETIMFSDDPAIVNSFKRKFDDLWVDGTNYSVYANVTSRVRTYDLYPISADLNFPPGQSFANRLIAREKAETQKIDVQMYRITQQAHSDALIAAWQRGVPVRYLGETREYRNLARLWVAWNMDRMYAAGIPMRVRASEGEFHEKLVLLYAQGMSVFGSSNFTSPSDSSQQEHNYFTTKNWIFNYFEDQFNRMWNNSTGNVETTAFVPLPPHTPSNIAVPNGATGVPTTGQALTWHAGPWGQYYDVYFGTSATPPLFATNLLLGPSESSSDHQSLTLPTLAPGTTYFWKIVSKTAAGVSRTGTTWSFTTAGGGGGGGGLPAPWADADIGSVTIAGSAQFNDGTFSVNASGADIWNAADAFHFVYQQMTGDGTVEARVTGVQQANAWSKAGVMIRETLTATSTNAMMLVSAANGTRFQWRPTQGGASQSIIGSAATAPRWLRLTRAGDVITGYESADGTTWTTVGSRTIAMASTVYIGLAVTSHNTSATTTASVDNVTTPAGGSGGGGGGGGSLPPPWTDGDVGAVPIAGSAQESSGTFIVNGSGADIWNTADAFHFVYQPMTGDGSIQARVTGIQQADAWSKAGVMIRESLDANSKHALMLVSAANGTRFLWRSATGGASQSLVGPAAAAPVWVRVTRSGDTLTGYQSADGVSWTAVGSRTISMASTVYIGLAITSHSTSASATATFDGVAGP
jgi:regulation of enolase protein 1 (concanavalin A-like superfamily)